MLIWCTGVGCLPIPNVWVKSELIYIDRMVQCAGGRMEKVTKRFIRANQCKASRGEGHAESTWPKAAAWRLVWVVQVVSVRLMVAWVGLRWFWPSRVCVCKRKQLGQPWLRCLPYKYARSSLNKSVVALYHSISLSQHPSTHSRTRACPVVLSVVRQYVQNKFKLYTQSCFLWAKL